METVNSLPWEYILACGQVHKYTNQKREMLYNKTYQGNVHEVIL